MTMLASERIAFTHVVSQGETLAQIAIRFYGTPRFEAALIGANALDAHGGSAIVAGQPLEIPAPRIIASSDGETWFGLARVTRRRERAEVLARTNGGVSWVRPGRGQEIEIPAVVAHIVGRERHMTCSPQRYLGDINKSWELDVYNGCDGSWRCSAATSSSSRSWTSR